MINYKTGDLIKTRIIDRDGIISFFEPSSDDKENAYLIVIDDEFDVIHWNTDISCVEVYYDKCFYTVETINLERC
tara:strand:- start:12 stop:236 length:225 start_codon:yes stop_codon:yes gene_type:complete